MIRVKIGNKKGITLISLVITIIILLILAGVSIAMLTGENGILTQVKKAKDETENSQVTEENILTNYEQIINSATGVTLETITGFETSNTVTQDSLGNRVVVPAGFKVVIPEGVSLENYNVENGIVIEDVSHEATKGSQFVWIPVGEKIRKKDGRLFKIGLERHEFDFNTGVAIDYIASCKEENAKEHTFDNLPAKDIEGFIRKTEKSGGYYIGRYEARTSVERKNKQDKITQMTLKPDEYVYNYVTQPQAATLSRNMYNDINFESDLINSYAWDTAIVFLLECDNREDKMTPYSIQKSLNDELAERGTNNMDRKDVICNIFDMASNCYEWSTETGGRDTHPCVNRGGYYNSNHYTGCRSDIEVTNSYYDSCFRPILYL